MSSLSKDQKLKLACLVCDSKEVLFGKFSPTVTKAARNKKWDEIFQQMVAVGAPVKDAKHLRKPTWDNFRRRTVQKFQESLKTGAAGSKLQELDGIILDCVNADASFLTGLGQDDEMPAFKSQPQVTKADESTKDDDNNGSSDETFSTADEESPSAPQKEGNPPIVGSKPKQSKGKKRQQTGENLWSDNEFKSLKKQKLQAALEEQQVRITLMKHQSLLYQAQTRLANEQAELVRLQVEDLVCKKSTQNSEILLTYLPNAAEVQQILNK